MSIPTTGLVRVRGPLGEIVVTAKSYDLIYVDKGFEYVGPYDGSAEVDPSLSLSDEDASELLKRKSRLRGKSGEGAVKLAGGDPDEARILFRAEQAGQNRPDILDALLTVIDS